MRHFSGCAHALTLSVLVAILTFGAIGCRKESGESGPNTAPSQTSTGIAGKYVAGIKRSDDVVELFRLDLNRQANDVSGVLDFLSSMLDSIDAYANNPQKIDVQVFENFAERPVKITGKVDGNSIEFSSTDPLVVGNYIYNWHFKGQIQGDKLVGQMDEKMKNEDQDESAENTQTVAITFNKGENK